MDRSASGPRLIAQVESENTIGAVGAKPFHFTGLTKRNAILRAPVP
jgi:hypothetical protein